MSQIETLRTGVRYVQTLCKIPYFHLVYWCENCVFPQNFHIRKLGEIMFFSRSESKQ